LFAAALMLLKVVHPGIVMLEATTDMLDLSLAMLKIAGSLPAVEKFQH